MSSTSSASGPTVRRRIFHPGSTMMIVGALCVLVGSLLPWVRTAAGNLPGYGGPGLWTGTLALALFAGAVIPYRVSAVAHCAVVGLPVAFIAAWQSVELGRTVAATDAWWHVWAGEGLVLTGAGAVVVLATAWRLYRNPF
ncbi:hypothetical protein [Myceligenerans salitolerans]|uniref:SPW repeat-containing protein n=1 Tax=Myceligenerans salitolerans TaxID=1230528 RepID=A0ABS3I4C3_9MICO|nr:hypothetical protein [Myceligenerans salitolerans]MBO0607866.1 hypothetical protein [Myceligenerans salitolerans]